MWLKQLSLICYMGGKQRLVKHLLPLIPHHEVYVETFGGSAALLLNKPPSSREVYNDIDGNLVNLFQVVRDQPQAFMKHCRGLPYSRQLYEEWRKPILGTDGALPNDRVDRAVRFFYVIRSAFYGHPAKGWRFALKSNEAERILNSVEEVAEIAKRLRSVYVDCLDFRRCIKNWDGPGTFFFLDPPYVNATPFLRPFTDQDHEDLAAILRHVEGKWLLTYNDAASIREKYAGFHMQRVRQPLASYKPKLGEARPRWTQLIIRNYPLPK